jgi:hypothetical protein
MDDVKCRHKDADKWRKRHYKLCIWTPLSDVETSIKSTLKGRQKSRQKGQPIAALFICVFLDAKKKVAHCYSVFYIEIFDFDNFDMIL